MPRLPPASSLLAAVLLVASATLVIASWFAPWAYVPGDPTVAPYTLWSTFNQLIENAPQTSPASSNLVIFSLALFAPPALLLISAVANLFAARPWARAILTGVVLIAGLAGLLFTTIATIGYAFTFNGPRHIIDYGVALAVVGYSSALLGSFLLPRRRESPLVPASPAT